MYGKCKFRIQEILAAKSSKLHQPIFTVVTVVTQTAMLMPVLCAMAGDNEQILTRRPFTWIDPKVNQVIPWSLHTFPENFVQIGPAVFS